MSQYVITDGERYLYKNKRGQYVPIANESLADVFTKKQAEGIYNNSLSKALKSVFYVQKCNVPPSNIKQVTQSDIDNTEKVMVSENVQHWLDKMADLNGLITDVANRREELNRQLSEVDKELCDCLHYIEFCNLNAAQGYKAYKLVKERRIRRRSIKNELTVLDIILGKGLDKSIIDEITKTVERLDARMYEPRVMKELFDL